MDSKTQKDTIYIDAEDEITAIIDKMRASEGKITALVLPKRTPTLQSIVNLKLLKRVAKESKKNIVLITSDPGLLPIAGAVGIHVAKTLQSQPAIPDAPQLKENVTMVADEPAGAAESKLDPQATVGQLAGHVATEETIELDNEGAEAAAEATDKKPKKDLNKKLKVPNFGRFRLLLFGGIALLLLLIVGSVFALIILPKATITVHTDTASISANLVVTAKTDAKSVDEKLLIIPAVQKQLKKTENEKVPTTGQRDEGTKATGTVTITNCNEQSDDGITVPAGTVLSTSNGGTALAFVTNEPVFIAQSNFTGSNVCKNDSFKNVKVTAQAAGGQYNLGAHRQFSTTLSGISGTDSTAMTGGTSKLVQIVAQADIDKAKQKIIERIQAAANSELKKQFETEKALGLNDTFAAGPEAVTSTPNVNDAAGEVTVSVTVTFSGLGVKQDDLKQLVEAEIKKQIDTSKQSIQDNGLGKANFLIAEKKPNEVKFEVRSLAIAGPQLDEEGIKKAIVGKRKSEVESIIRARPGIRDVEIRYSPFWVYSTPKSTKRIEVVFNQSNGGN